jgi:hypothetical protein
MMDFLSGLHFRSSVPICSPLEYKLGHSYLVGNISTGRDSDPDHHFGNSFGNYGISILMIYLC